MKMPNIQFQWMMDTWHCMFLYLKNTNKLDYGYNKTFS